MSPRLVCYYCGVGCQITPQHRLGSVPKDSYTIDHVFPKHEREEMRKTIRGWRISQIYFTLPACYGCNQARGSMPFLEFVGIAVSPAIEGPKI